MQDELDPKTNEEGLTRRVVSRREFLKYAGITGAAIGLSGGLGGLLAACGEEEETTTTAAGETTTTAAGETTTTAAGATTTVSAGPEPPAQDKIVYGGARPITGSTGRLRGRQLGSRLQSVGGRREQGRRPQGGRQDRCLSSSKSTTTRATSTRACVCSRN